MYKKYKNKPKEILKIKECLEKSKEIFKNILILIFEI